MMREAINCNQRAIKEKGQSNPIGKQAQGAINCGVTFTLRRVVHTSFWLSVTKFRRSSSCCSNTPWYLWGTGVGYAP